VAVTTPRVADAARSALALTVAVSEAQQAAAGALLAAYPGEAGLRVLLDGYVHVLRSVALQRITDAGDRSLILILSDINMPGMSGLELLPQARAARPDVPIIMITAYGDAETKRKALEGGAEALLTKPIDFVMLRSEIDTRVERAA